MSDGEGIGLFIVIGGIVLTVALTRSIPQDVNLAKIDKTPVAVQELPNVKLMSTEYRDRVTYRQGVFGKSSRHNVYEFSTPLGDTLYLLKRHKHFLTLHPEDKGPINHDAGQNYNIEYKPLLDGRKMFSGSYRYKTSYGNDKSKEKVSFTSSLDGVLTSIEPVVRGNE